jgi:hypothetical protein
MKKTQRGHRASLAIGVDLFVGRPLWLAAGPRVFAPPALGALPDTNLVIRHAIENPIVAPKVSYAGQIFGRCLSPGKFSGDTVMGWIFAIVALSLVMTVMTIAELRRPVSTNTVQLPEFTVADRAIAVFVLGIFTLAILNGIVLVAARTLP